MVCKNPAHSPSQGIILPFHYSQKSKMRVDIYSQFWEYKILLFTILALTANLLIFPNIFLIEIPRLN